MACALLESTGGRVTGAVYDYKLPQMATCGTYRYSKCASARVCVCVCTRTKDGPNNKLPHSFRKGHQEARLPRGPRVGPEILLDLPPITRARVPQGAMALIRFGWSPSGRERKVGVEARRSRDRGEWRVGNEMK